MARIDALGHNMRVRLALLVILLSGTIFAQPTTPGCPSDRPVDDIIAQINKARPRKNKNPLPDTICMWGWCRDVKHPSPPAPPPSSTTDTTMQSASKSSNSDQASSSKSEAEKCNDAMELALEAAHDVEVGDYSFEKQSYQGALLRYRDAAEQKPHDAAIQVRLGRTAEKLSMPEEATQHYSEAVKIGSPEKWVQEAQVALTRIKRATSQ